MVNQVELKKILLKIGERADQLMLVAEQEMEKVQALDVQATADIVSKREHLLQELSLLQGYLVGVAGVSEEKSLSEVLQDAALQHLEALRQDVFQRLQKAMEKNTANRLLIQASQSAVQSVLELSGMQPAEKVTYGRFGALRGGAA